MRKRFVVGLIVLAACSSPVTTGQIVPAPANPSTLIATAPATASTTAAVQSSPAGSRGLPAQLSDADFWKLQADVSEPGGYFRIEDNYTSNEMEVGQLFTMLRDRKIAGDVYLGVGPEQNFTYIAAIRPRMAFIVDIRRQAAMQHLMFKAVFELAADRADFISLLFAKPRPAGLDSTTSIQAMWEAYRTVATDSALGARNYNRIVDRLTKTQRFVFTQDERDKLKAVYDAFFYYGPSITTRGSPSGRGGDFAALTAYSYDNAGQPRSFLSSEENYRYVKMLHDRNLIVPVTGDFGGAKALRAIGAYLKEHDAVVRAFYVSNVEQYLFGDAKDREFYANVAALPVDSASVFIRPYSMRRGGMGGVESLCPIQSFVASALAGRVMSNDAALACVR
jgi:hypothetical protein